MFVLASDTPAVVTLIAALGGALIALVASGITAFATIREHRSAEFRTRMIEAADAFLETAATSGRAWREVRIHIVTVLIEERPGNPEFLATSLNERMEIARDENDAVFAARRRIALIFGDGPTQAGAEYVERILVSLRNTLFMLRGTIEADLPDRQEQLANIQEGVGVLETELGLTLEALSRTARREVRGEHRSGFVKPSASNLRLVVSAVVALIVLMEFVTRA